MAEATTWDEYVERVGADAIRCYLMFLGPWDQGGDWIDAGIGGMSRWLGRVWALCALDPSEVEGAVPDPEASRELERTAHKTVRAVTQDLGAFKFNTSIAALMKMTNAMASAAEAGGVDPATWRSAIERLVLMLAPMAPHIAEELWERSGGPYSVHSQRWPEWDPELAADEVITLVVQVNGRVRDKIEAPADIGEDAARELALASQRVAVHTEGKTVARVIYVPGRLVNVVAR